MKQLPAPKVEENKPAGGLSAPGAGSVNSNLPKITFTQEELDSYSNEDAWNALVDNAKDDLLNYVVLMDPKYQPSYIHLYLSRVLRLAEQGKMKRIIITMPPRHGKSRITSEEFAAWYLSKHPEKEVIVSSYAQDRSNKISIKVRDRLESPANMEIFPDARVHPDNRKADDWATTAGGSFLSAGVGGAITGMGADLFIIDDPIKNREEAESPGTREKVWDWFTSTAYTRLSPDGIMIIIMTRWHEDDLVGRLLDPDSKQDMVDAGLSDENFRVFKFPAIADVEDKIGREKGMPLWPERWTAKKLEAIRRRVGGYDWSALYQCQPRMKGGNYVKREWFKTIPRAEVPKGLRWVRFWDLASSEKKYSDFTASFAIARDPKTKRIFLRDMEHFKKEWPDAKRRICARALLERITLGVESQGMQKVAFNEIKKALFGKCLVREITNDKDKLTKALPFIAQAEAGFVYLVEGDWHWTFYDEMEAFPAGKHDDIPDAAAGGYNLVVSAGTCALA